MNSAFLLFHRDVALLTRKFVATGVFLLFSSMLLWGQSSEQVIYLDENGQTSINTGELDDCFTSTIYQPSRAQGDDHAVWLSNNSFSGSSTDFLFEAGAILEQNPDGTATVRGTLYNTRNATDKWEVQLFLSDKKSWTEWSALGRGYKDERGLAGSNFTDWDYYIEDPSKVSKLVGIAGNVGKTVELKHNPTDYFYGFQIGTGANNKNAGFGMSGWFLYSLNGTNFYQGDFNLDLEELEREITYTTASLDCNNLGENAVDVIATDQFGNTCTQEVIVTVVDNTAPVIVPVDINLDLNADGKATAIAEEVYSSITDNCEVVSIVVDPIEFDCDDLGEQTVTITATDAAGNVSTATATVTVRDVTPPTLVTRNINVGLNNMGMVTIQPQDVIRFDCGGGTGGISEPVPVPGEGEAVTFTANNCTSDNCGIATFTVSKMKFDCNDAGQNVVTVTVTDASGNSTTKTAIVRVRDSSRPTVRARNITVELDENGMVVVDPAQVNNGSSDLCGNLTLTLSKTTFNCDDLGNNNVTLIGRDQSGNTSTANAVITVVDNLAPVVVTQNITVALDQNGMASIEARDLLIICDDAVIEEDNNGGGGGGGFFGFEPGTGEAEQPAAFFDLNDPTCTKDNCKITSILASMEQFDCSHIGENIVTVTVTDAEGNETEATAIVTVVDDIAPVAVAQNITVDLDADGNATITANDIDNGSSDNCDIVKTIDRDTFSCDDLGTPQLVTLTVTDPAGNTAIATANVTVRDIIAPTVIAQNITVALDAAGNAAITTAQVDNGSYDNCNIDLSLDNLNFDCNDLGENTVVLTGTDNSGNTASATAIVTVVDDIDPVITTTNITIDLDANGQATITDSQVAAVTDNCEVTFTVSELEFDCDDLGEQTVTITATDAAGNVSTATATVTVRDVTPPTLVTRNINVGLNNMGMVTIQPQDVIRFDCGGGTGGISEPVPVPGEGEAVTFTANNCTSDNCGIATFTVSKMKFDCNDAGQNVVTVTVTDASGNSTTKTAIVTVRDSSRPTVRARNITVELDENGMVVVDPAQVNNGSSDLCGNLTLTLSKTTFNCDDLGNNNVTLIGRDQSGNTSTANAVITVVDNLAPVVVTQNITVALDQNGMASIEARDLLIICDDAVIEEDNNGGGGGGGFFGFEPGTGEAEQPAAFFDLNDPTCTKDNCKITSILASMEQFDCSHIGENIVTVTVTDAEGNETEATAIVTVVDDIAPVAVAQNITVDLDADGNATITANDIDNGSSDNCDIVKTIDRDTFSCDDLGTPQLVTLTVTDPAGNTAIATANVTVRDIIAPTVIAQNITVALDAAGNAAITTAQVDNGSYDNCNIDLSLDNLNFDCNDLGENTVVLTGTDNSGNTASATAIVTVVDDIDPVITTTNITIDLDANGQATITDSQVAAVTDNCEVTFTVSELEFDCDDLGEQTVTITATDAAGNVSTATATVTVRDVTPPTLVTRNINVGLNNMGMVTIQPQDVIRFDCGGGTGGISEPVPVPGEGEAVTFTANNCTSDNCGIATFTVSKMKFDCNDAGQNVVTVTVTDASGNSTTKTAIVTVRDSSRPTVRARNITVELDENGMVVVDPAQVNNGSSDLCGNLTLTLSKTTFNCDDLGNNNVTLIGRDQSGNTSTANAVITVVDNLAPVVVTQNITVALDQNGMASIEARDLLIICDDAVIEEDNNGGGGGGGFFGFEPGTGEAEQPAAFFDLNDPTCTKDNCKITSILASMEQFDCSHIGENIVTVTVTDAEGNETEATAIVTVVDDIAPVAVAQNITVDLDADGNATITANDIDNGSSDNCDIVKTIDRDTFSCDDLGTPQLVTLTVTDPAGNTAIATANVTVRDIIAPTVIAQNITVALDAAGNAAITTAQVDNGSYDNCNIDLSLDNLNFDCNDLGENTVVLTGTDNSGNTASATAIVTVVDDIDPVITTTNITVDLDANGQATIIESQVAAVTDNCEVTFTVSELEFDCDDLGEQTVTITATDAAGNVSTATATVTVRDVTPPTLVTRNINVGLNNMGMVTIQPQDVIRFDCGGGTGGISEPVPVPGEGEAVTFTANNCTSDNCGIATFTVSKMKFDCNDAGQNVVTVTVTDASGNSTTKTAIVTVRDSSRPTVRARNITVELDENGMVVVDPAQVNNGSSDLCGNLTLTLSKTTFNCDDLGNNNVTLIGRDQSGNTSTANAVITVVDNMAPVVVTQNITVALDQNGMASIEARDLLIICDDAVIEEDNNGGGGGGGFFGFEPGTGEVEQPAAFFDLNDPTCTKDNCKITSILASMEQFDCSHIGENIVTVTVTDAEGNETEATAIVTVVDDIAPVAVAQNITVDLDANGNATITANDIDNGSSDNCDIVKTIDRDTFSCDDLGTPQLVTLTVTDPAGNTAIATANVTVRDIIAPTVIAQNITVALDAAGNAAITTAQVDNGSYDNCNIDLSLDNLNFDCNDLGENTVVLTGTDNSGNTATATAIVTVVDDIDPVITTTNITVDLDANGQATIIESQVAAVTDNCEVTFTVSELEFDCDDLGEQTVTITATDAAGNVSTATATVTVRDVTPPTLVTRNINVGLNNMGMVTIQPQDVIRFDCGGGTGGISEPVPVPGEGEAVTFTANNCTSDNCGIATFTVSKMKFDCNDAGQNVVTVTVTDASGNSTTKTAIVTVRDSSRPTVRARNITVELDENGMVVVDPAQVNNGSSDLCGNLTLTLSKTTFNCDDLGNNNVTLIGRDQSGNTSTANAVITVVDNMAPVVVTQNITVALDQNGMASIEARDLLIICDDAVIEEDNNGGGGGGGFFGFEPGTGEVEQPAAFFDLNDPTCTKDNCKITSILASMEQFDCSHIGENIVTVTVTDAEGNETEATAIVTVVDDIAPVAVAQNITVDLDANGNATITANDIDNGSSDNCDIVKTIDRDTFSCDDLGTPQLVTLTVTDPAGNTAIATANVTVRDIIAPTVIAQNITVALDAAGNAAITTAQVDNGSYDNCNLTLALDNLNFDCNDLGENTVVLTGTDNSGNTATATAIVTVVDDIDPVITTTNITVDLDANGQATIIESQVAAVTDNCEVTFTVSELEFDCDDLGEQTVTITATDAAGNVSTATATVTVRDVISPIITTQNVTVDLDANGKAIITESQVISSVTDNCQVTETVVTQTEFDCSDLGENTVTIQAADAAGNITTTSVIVTVRDVTAPVVITQDITVALNASGNVSISTAQIDNGSYDNCNLNLSLDQLSFDCNDLGQNTVILTGTDASGNTASATATVTVVDNTAPVINTQNITVDLDANGKAVITESQVISGVTDNCQVTETVVTQTEFDCSDLGENTVTIQAADAAGNITTTSVIVTVRDVTAPVVITQNATVTLDASGNASIAIAQINNGSFDNCNLSLSLDQLDFDCSNVGENTVTLTGTDNSGNTASATATVTVIDNSAPVITPNDITVALDENGNASIDAADLVDNAGTECSVVKYGGNNSHAVWLSKYFDNGSNAKFHFVDNSGVLTQNPDGTATVRGTVANKDNSNDGWIVELNLFNRRSWNEWSALGRNWKGSANNVGNNFQDWDYYEMDTNIASTLTGIGDNASEVKTLRHAPANYNFGFQVGEAANDKDKGLGFSGWFTYLNDKGQYVQGDFNLDITECTTIVNGSACGDATIVVDQTDFTCADLGENTVTITATSSNGNVATETVTVTITDDITPVVLTQNISVTLDSNGQATITTGQIDNGSYDNCNLNLSLDQLSFDCNDLGKNTVILTGTDASGNTASATATVTVVDNTAPVINTQNITVDLDANGKAVITESQVISGVTDNCQVTETVVTQTEFDCSDLGENTVTIQAADAAGNITTTSVIVTVRDVTAPVVITQNATVTLDASGNASIAIAQINNGSFDNCNLSLSLDQLDFDCSNVGENTVTLTGTDNSGNTASATATVTVIDNSAPVITPNDITVALDENGNASINAADLVDNAGTECSVVKYGGNNSHAVWLSKYFDNGSNAKFHFVDNSGVLTQNPDGTATVRGTVANKDNSNDGWIVELNLFNRRSWNEWSALGRNWKGSANNVGNNFQDWDYYEMDTNIASTLTGIGDNAGEVKTLRHAPANYNFGFQVGEAANDKDKGLGFSGWFTYLNDKGQYVQGDFNLDITECTTIVNGSACGDATIVVDQTDFTCADLGENTVTITATSSNGNVATEIVTVTVVDNIAPVVESRDVFVSLDADGKASLTANQVSVNSYDNCGLRLSISQTQFDCSDLGRNVVTLTGTDVSGNSTEDEFVVFVKDEIAPEISNVPTDIVVTDAGNDCAEPVVWNIPTVTDNCRVVLTSSHQPGDVFPVGTTTVTYTARDNANNTTAASFEITVLSEPIVVSLDVIRDASCSQPTGAVDATVQGGCGDYTYSWSNGATTPQLTDLAAGVYSLTVTDAKGNRGTASVEIVNINNLYVAGSVSPEYPVPFGDKHTIYLGYGEQVVTINAGASGGSGNYTYNWSSTGELGCTSENTATVAPEVTTTYTVTVTDTETGCTSTKDFTIEVIDTRCGNGSYISEGDEGDDNESTSCQCEGRMRNFTFEYNGVSGVTIKAFNKKFDVLIDQFNNVQNGDILTVEGYDRHNRLDSKTYLKIGSTKYEIHTSCSIDILGESYGPFTITGYTDGEGSSCSIESAADNSISCDVSDAENGGHALWLSNYSRFGNAQFVFDEHGGSINRTDDGKAILTGVVYNVHNSHDRWEIQLFLSDGMNWSEWSALGRSYKDERGLAGNRYLDWTYYIIDPNQATLLTGLDNNSGKTRRLYHMPLNHHYGFQVGEGANNKNLNYGISGWFFYKNYQGHWTQGDFNMDIDNCSQPEETCDVDPGEWTGGVIICYNGRSYCVDKDYVDYFIAHGATLGRCSTLASHIVENGLSREQIINGEGRTENTLQTDTPEITISAYPNPTSGIANITFSVSEGGPVNLSVYGTKGKLIGTLYNDEALANTEYKVTFDGSGVREGVYLIRLRSNGHLETKKLMIKR